MLRILVFLLRLLEGFKFDSALVVIKGYCDHGQKYSNAFVFNFQKFVPALMFSLMDGPIL